MPAATRNDSPFVFGNKKLPKTTAVLNICPASLCPSALLGLCQLKDCALCYARQEEKVWANTCLPSRMKMQEYFDRSTPWAVAKDLLSLNDKKRTKLAALRIGECGDFRHQADLEKAENIAHYLLKNGIETYCYTARRDLDFSDVRDMVVNGSGWMANNRFQVAYKLRKTETGWEAEDKTGAWVPCDSVCPGDCRRCALCREKKGRTIAVMLH